MQNTMEIVLKNLDFIDDQGLQSILEARLGELERVFSVNANLSTIILSISCIEGIFRHIATIFRTQLRASPSHPLKTDGITKKDFDDLTLEEIYKLLLERDILHPIPNFDQIYTLFRNYRNFIHPQAQAKKSWPLGLGQAQMALGLLNATIDQISSYIFIGPEIITSISGRPQFDLSKVLQLFLSTTPTHSFALLKRKITSKFNMRFDLELARRAVFNFVFNFVDEHNFKMLRLDNRSPYYNALLHCMQKYRWVVVAKGVPAQPPPGILSVEISISLDENKFDFVINGQPLRFVDQNGVVVNLFSEFRGGLKLGWFNEVGPVKMSNIQIT